MARVVRVIRSLEVLDGVGAALAVLDTVEANILTQVFVHPQVYHVLLTDVHLGEVVDASHHLRLVAQQFQLGNRATKLCLHLWFDGSDDRLHLSCGCLLVRCASRPHASIYLVHAHQDCC